MNNYNYLIDLKDIETANIINVNKNMELKNIAIY